MKSVNNNLFSLEGKKILITGGSSGIGRQFAVNCSNSGAGVIIVGRNQARLSETMSLLSPGNHEIIEADLENEDSYEKITNFIKAKIGSVDGFVHSAGVELTLPLTTMKVRNYERLFKVNVISGFEIAKFLVRKRLVDSNGASFIFISSVMGLLGQTGKVGYCSSKGAVISGVKAMALELAPLKIRVNSILPGVCKTPMSEDLFANIPDESKQRIEQMHPLGIGEPNDIANAGIFLLSDASEWITGSELVVDGGYSIH